MPITGRKPKPEHLRRNRVPPRFDWLEVPDVEFRGAPKLPAYPGRPRGRRAPAPPRPLGQAGRELWRSVWRSGGIEIIDADVLAVVCEQLDERAALRTSVLDSGDWRDRAGLRALEDQVRRGLAPLNAGGIRTPSTWPAATRRWWRAVSTMPHCATWHDSDWQYAIDSASVAAAFHSGDMRWAGELRARERVMGTTADARRDLRVRYVPPGGDGDRESSATVSAMAAYRRENGP